MKPIYHENYPIIRRTIKRLLSINGITKDTPGILHGLCKYILLHFLKFGMFGPAYIRISAYDGSIGKLFYYELLTDSAAYTIKLE